MIDDRAVQLPVVFLVLASSALLAALVALWSSLRAAFGGGPQPALVGAADLPDRAALEDEKKALLRAIKDLEYEHAVGKISDEDHTRLDRAYRARAKEVLALLDRDVLPFRARAEALLAGEAEAPKKAEKPKKKKKSEPKPDEAPKAEAAKPDDEAPKVEAAKPDEAASVDEAEAAKPDEAASVETDAPKGDGTSLRERAQALRAEAERLERLLAEEAAAKAAKDASPADTKDEA